MSLFNVSNNLRSIISTIEENGGEVDEELIEDYEFTQANFKEEVLAFTNIIHEEEGDIDAIDKEIDRLKKLKDTKSKLVTRLSNRLIDCVELFGVENKSHNLIIDCGTTKIGIRKSKKVEESKESIDIATRQLAVLVEEYKMSNSINEKDEIPIEDIMDSFNRAQRYNKETDEFEDFKLFINKDELKAINGNISVNLSFEELMKSNGYSLLRLLTNYGIPFTLKGSLNKSLVKEDDKLGKSYPHIGSVVNNKSLSIK